MEGNGNIKINWKKGNSNNEMKKDDKMTKEGRKEGGGRTKINSRAVGVIKRKREEKIKRMK